MYSGKHVQEPTPFCSLHTAFVPQGDGWQGRLGAGGSPKRTYLYPICEINPWLSSLRTFYRSLARLTRQLTEI